MPSLFSGSSYSTLLRAIDAGDSATFYQEYCNNPRTIYERDASGRNLLDHILHAIHMNDVKAESHQRRHSSAAVQLHSLVIMGLHLLRSGLHPTHATLNTHLPTIYDFANLRCASQCSIIDVENMEAFLILVTKNEPPLPRALRLFAFAFWNPEHTPAVEAVYMDIVKTQSGRQQSTHAVVDRAVEAYHARGDAFGPGAEAVAFRALLEYHGSALKYTALDIIYPDANASMEAVRRILRAMLEPVADPGGSLITDRETIQEYVDRALNLVRVCVGLPLLDGLGGMVAA